MRKLECGHYYKVLGKEVVYNGNGTETQRMHLECELCGLHIYESITTQIAPAVEYKECTHKFIEGPSKTHYYEGLYYSLTDLICPKCGYQTQDRRLIK